MHSSGYSDEKKKQTVVGEERAVSNASGRLSLGLSLLAESGVLGGASLEAVLESSGNVLEVAGAASADGPSPLGLLAPVVCVKRWLDYNSRRYTKHGNTRLFPMYRNIGESRKGGSEHTLSHLSGGVSARRALVLLDVQRTAT